MFEDPAAKSSALADFKRARNQAILKEMISRFTGVSNELLSYEEVRQKLKVLGAAERGLHEIPLEAIVGSVGRYSDFTRDFLPRAGVNEARWARVRMAAGGLVGMDPIEVYQIGETYFVKDGNHRVSVARQLDAKTIQAYVTQVRTLVPITPDIQPDELIVKAEYADFLEKTHLNKLRPEVDLSVTVPGQYPILEEHISVHRYFMGIDQKREIYYPEAVVHWYDEVYLAIVRIIREWGILRNFPNRTEADLYLWIAEHRALLEKEYGWKIRTEAAMRDLLVQFGTSDAGLFSRIRSVLTPDKLEAGPPAGEWREEILADYRGDRLFSQILAPISGAPDAWYGFEQALVIARRENAHLYGLHVVPNEEQKEQEAAQEVRNEFNRRCSAAGISGHLVIAAGEISQEICRRSRWADLIVTNLAYPPGPRPLAKLESGFHDMIQRCPKPLLAAPQTSTPLDRALLAYDGSPKAQEALFVAAYLAVHWKISLAVIAVIDESSVTHQTLRRAQDYLEEQGVQALCIEEKGTKPAEIILRAAKEQGSNLLLMGGYGTNPLLEVVLGSAVDQVLREAHKPVLICR